MCTGLILSRPGGGTGRWRRGWEVLFRTPPAGFSRREPSYVTNHQTMSAHRNCENISQLNRLVSHPSAERTCGRNHICQSKSEQFKTRYADMQSDEKSWMYSINNRSWLWDQHQTRISEGLWRRNCPRAEPAASSWWPLSSERRHCSGWKLTAAHGCEVKGYLSVSSLFRSLIRPSGVQWSENRKSWFRVICLLSELHPGVLNLESFWTLSESNKQPWNTKLEESWSQSHKMYRIDVKLKLSGCTVSQGQHEKNDISRW